eukprot:CAMPEP_0201881706 /NCGR_PEP_ID=MMETSP0902-20130614/11930_1 /ASSEMBLY_ACC=CAM_ASM_000551 /TAXON_ID=420261 /ORGANISM="Thalassiosira antarctica, Strain CCMP982" /LENGTH=985 /DNA_ID=CAMNT_0048409969 /DNA_START=19 /DNA_END=2979 /DNA_ORIENTATION=-
MSGYPTRVGSRNGVDRNALNISNGTNNNGAGISNNGAAAIFQQLAAAMQTTQGTMNPLQEEEVARMGMMLARLATGNSAPNDSANNQSNSISGTNIKSAADDRTAPFQRSFFHKERVGRNNRAYSSPAGTASIRLRPPPHQQQQIAPRISEQQQNWYSEERALLRELIVLTMRHSNGTLLRYVPSEEEQLQMWNTHGHPVANRFAPNIIAEGVRLFPKLNVMPEWSQDNGDNDDDDGFDGAVVREDLEFRANLQMPLLGSGARDAISLCGECGWLYGRVASYVEAVLEDDVDGVQCATARALAARMDDELAEYHGHLSLLESELPPLELSPSLIQRAPQSRYLTLRSLLARLPPMRDHLRTLAILADGVGACNLRGGKLLAAVLQHSLDGYTRHSDLVRSIAADCSVPWYKLLSQWMTQGVLEDIHSEFFVKEIKPEAMGGDIVTSSGFFTWHQRYILVEGLIPLCSCGGLMDIITVDLAREVLLVGKGINFIRYCLQDKDWEVAETEENESADNGAVVDHDRSYNFATLMDVSDDDELQCVSTLHDAVMKSSARIHSHILESLEKQHHMMHHLLALKHFLFLGQGDFVSSFVESLDQEFRGRTSIAGIYSHTLSAVLEGSLRKTNARFLPNFVLGNLRARLMQGKHDPDQYWMGLPPKAKEDEMTPWKDDEASIQDPWDFIYLDYKINSPLDAIVHGSAMETYQQVFFFLFRLKRVEWMLNNSWRQSTALNHAILTETRAGGADAPEISDAAEHSSFLLRRISSTRQTMLHFITNLQSYLMFEVLEGGWEGLVKSLNKARSLDDIIRAHDSYLNEIVDKTLLSNEGGENGVGKSLENLLRKLLSIALEFGKFQDHIFSNSLAGLDKAAKIRRKVDERAEKGDWGRKTLDKEEGRVFLYLADSTLFDFVERTANDFDGALSDLLKMMSKQIDEVDCNTGMDDDQEETDHVMKNHDALPFLLFRLDFSGYYARQARENRKKKKNNS